MVLMIIGLFCCLRRRRTTRGSNREGIVPMEQSDIPGVIRDYRPRSHSLDELHYQFGMNEIDKVTAKEGGDLVRIARPLETAGAERKLSEELFGIEPIIPDDNGQIKQTNETPWETEGEGE